MSDYDPTHAQKLDAICRRYDRAVLKIVGRIDSRFVSGNAVPVERAHIKQDEWAEIRQAVMHSLDKQP